MPMPFGFSPGAAPGSGMQFQMLRNLLKKMDSQPAQPTTLTTPASRPVPTTLSTPPAQPSQTTEVFPSETTSFKLPGMRAAEPGKDFGTIRKMVGKSKPGGKFVKVGGVTVLKTNDPDEALNFYDNLEGHRNAGGYYDPGELRGAYDVKNKTHYLWDASDAEHDMIMRKLGIPKTDNTYNVDDARRINGIFAIFKPKKP